MEAEIKFARANPFINKGTVSNMCHLGTSQIFRNIAPQWFHPRDRLA